MEEKKRKTDFEVMKKFISEVQKKEIDIEKVKEFMQITVANSKNVNIGITLDLLKERVLIGKCKLKLRKKLSDVCTILQVQTNSGIYSAKVICEKEEYKPDPKGTWGVNPLSFHKLK